MTDPTDRPLTTASPVAAATSAQLRPKRRGLLVVAAGSAAALAGAAVSWRHWMPGEAVGGADDGALLWQQAFDTPAGAPLDMAALRNRPLLVNFWATWCPPCVEELPMLDRFHRQQAAVASGWQVLGVAIDQPSAVQRFLQKTPVKFPVAMAGMQGTELAKALGNDAAGLPFTVALDKGGRVLHRKMGQLSESDLQRWSAA